MLEYENKKYLTTKEAHQMLNRSMEALRQLIYRGRLTRHKIGSRIYLDHDEVVTYYAKRMGIKPYTGANGSEVLTFNYVNDLLKYTPTYLRQLVKKDVLDGYCTPDGEILITKQSVEKYMGVYSDEANSL
jgi:excisionase family DNA binding protein